MSQAQSPLITFVGYARNDNYTPRYIDRLNLSIKALTRQATTYHLPIEVLIVEWNPPHNRPSLANVINKPQQSNFISIRIITVPPPHHLTVRGARNKGLHPARALNVGYRRANGVFVTPFASDSLLSDSVFKYAKKNSLNNRYIYRLDRYDVDEALLNQVNIHDIENANLIDLCDKNIVNHHAPQDQILSIPLRLPPLHTNAAGDFMLMAKTLWFEVCGQPEDCDVACLDTDSITLHAAAASGGTELRLPPECRLYKFAHHNMSTKRVTPDWNIWSRTLSTIIRALSSSPTKRAYLRGIADIPRRKLAGMPGNYVSFERNFFLRVRRWPSSKKKVKLNNQEWGLKGIPLEEIIL